MEHCTAEISVKGSWTSVPAAEISGRSVVVTGNWLKTAAIHDEEWLEGDVIGDPEIFVDALRDMPARPDLFRFSERLGAERTHPLHLEWEDVAAIRITTYADWWNGLPQGSRKNVQRAERRGLEVRLAAFDEEMVQGITRIYNETPFRQGRRFWHYGKDSASVQRDNASYLDRSDFVAAYFEGEMVGFIKIVYVDGVARIMQILSQNRHFDKRPANAMIAKAVEVCCQRGASHFVYGRYVYGNKASSSVTEFKRRNGFQRILVPTYYVPLTAKGYASIAFRFHRGWKMFIPEKLLNVLLDVRARFYRWTTGDSDGEKSLKE